ncbi:hypothetical protein DESUT3_15890 [Desulfuromonas versatilis]|uniref:Nitrate reductase molybdenum cofactor assembly chaperone n=1 Tax=Desulfuromonas versatilis TaxID=2802975 RepID=A0ABN6DWL0_9BACT|nr:molecular chaperone TorD family protein [Desulfuromonas versatilis]BCR04520.1 hypothetical protein DESUT3_15890 [Desulfuromonas versatilis]
MGELQRHQELCRRFATLLGYPREGLEETAAATAGLLSEACPAALAPLEGFSGFLAGTDAARVEEVFTATFDLQALCHPYVGYQLFGESQQRTLFLIQLQQLYRQHGFSPGSELPDHLGEVLRFVGSTDAGQVRGEIIEDGLLPALDKILQGMAERDNPYGQLITALQCFLSETAATGTEPLVVSRKKESCS